MSVSSPFTNSNTYWLYGRRGKHATFKRAMEAWKANQRFRCFFLVKNSCRNKWNFNFVYAIQRILVYLCSKFYQNICRKREILPMDRQGKRNVGIIWLAYQFHYHVLWCDKVDWQNLLACETQEVGESSDATSFPGDRFFSLQRVLFKIV